MFKRLKTILLPVAILAAVFGGVSANAATLPETRVGGYQLVDAASRQVEATQVPESQQANAFVRYDTASECSVAAKSEMKLLGTARDNLLNAAENPRLRDAINNLYRPGAKLGSGSSMDALRIEGTHLKKVFDRRAQLRSILAEETLSTSDKVIVRDLLLDIEDALKPYPGGR